MSALIWPGRVPGRPWQSDRKKGIGSAWILSGFPMGAPVNPSTPWITAFTPGTTRNNYAGYTGSQILVGAAPITVTRLGRYVYTGNNQTHGVYLVDSAFTVLATGNINTSGLPQGFAYVSVTPVILAANTYYYLVSEEFLSGDAWGDGTAAITTTSAASSVAAAYGATIPALGTVGGNPYVPPNFEYQ